MPAGEQITFQPALAQVLAQHLHHSAVGRHVVVGLHDFRHGTAIRDVENGVPAVGRGFVRAEHAEVLRVALQHVANKFPLNACCFGLGRAGLGDIDRVVAEIWQTQIPQEHPAVGMRVGAHPARPFRRKGRQFRAQLAGSVEEVLRPVALHPSLKDSDVFGLVHVAHRHLMGAETALDPLAIHDFRPRPSLGRAQHNHRPAWTRGETSSARFVLDGLDIGDDRIERCRHELVHLGRFSSFDETRPIAVAAEQRLQLLLGDAGQHRRAGDLVAIEVQDGQDRAVAHGIEELVRMPARRQRPGLGLPVADDAGGDQVRIVEYRAVRVRERIAQLATFMDRSRRFRRDVTRDAAREGELFEQLLHAFLVLRDVGVKFAVAPFQVGIGHQPGTAVTRPGDVDDVQVLFVDDAVEVDVEEVQAGRRAPMAQQPRLDVFALQRLL